MDILKFTLSGKHAFFKKPEVNTYYYFTYGNIHKIALLGIFGAILGYGGYNQMNESKEKSEYPEFYTRLSGLQVAMVPAGKHRKGHIPKKLQSFNNSVGYASKEQGGNLIIEEQWLEYPSWDIYVKIDSEEAHKLKEALFHQRCVYMPYLGKNDHPADIKDVVILDGNITGEEELTRLDSFFIKDTVSLDSEDDEIVPFKYEEYLPIALTKETNMYEFKKFVYTNLPVKSHCCDVWQVDRKYIVFY